jgi:hypothetical protein
MQFWNALKRFLLTSSFYNSEEYFNYQQQLVITNRNLNSCYCYQMLMVLGMLLIIIFFPIVKSPTTGYTVLQAGRYLRTGHRGPGSGRQIKKKKKSRLKYGMREKTAVYGREIWDLYWKQCWYHSVTEFFFVMMLLVPEGAEAIAYWLSA